MFACADRNFACTHGLCNRYINIILFHINTQAAYNDAGSIAVEAISGIRTLQSMPESLPMFEADYARGLSLTLAAGVPSICNYKERSSN
jgi:hypothetical protein